MGNFSQISTEQFRKQMRPAAIKIYESLFPGCEIIDLPRTDTGTHVLDQHFGIDSIISLPTGGLITLQEKYREHYYLNYADFTQEYMNAAGTPDESPGEWFKLAAQLYFYGWANAEHTDFEKWLLLDVLAYKVLVEKAGGLENLGTLQQNRKFGCASFYAIPLGLLKPAIIWSSNRMNKGGNN